MGKADVLMIGAYPAWDMDDLEARYTVHRLWEAANRDAYVTSIGPNVRAIATRGELGAPADLMSRLPRLEIVSCYGVGTDAIDLAHARAHGIAVTNTPDVLTEDVADLGVGLLLATARAIPAGDAHVRSGNWANGNLRLTTRVHGKAVGIVGMGRIGAALARRLRAFDCDIAYFNRSPRPDSPYHFVGNLVELAGRSEFLVVTVAGGDGTRGLIDAAVLKALGPDGILINIARGTTVDEDALDPRFTMLDNVVLQPHAGSGTIETRKAMGQLVRDNLAAHFAGQPLLTPVA
jgi:lactate dehydrogenase-like 2-hydroxyacid dehydrogenase